MANYREIGAELSGDRVDRLRSAVPWVKTRHGFRMNDIAASAGVELYTLRNFVSGKSRRPGDVFLGRLDVYFKSNAKLLPEDYLAKGDVPSPSPSPDQGIGKLVRQGDIQRLLPVSERDLSRIYDRYSGAYLCFGLSYNPSKIAVAWMNITGRRARSGQGANGLPIPRFTVVMKYPDRIDPRVMHSYTVGGFVICHNGMLFLTGHHDCDLKHMVLREPSAPKFTYLQGVALLTSVNDRQPFAVRALCQYLGRRVARLAWMDRVGVYSVDELPRTFENAEDVIRAIGDSGVLKGFDTE